MSPHKIDIIKIQFPGIRIQPFDIPKFRGSISRQFPRFYLIHNHLNDGSLRYGYPLIQFKTVDKIPTIIGLEEGITILKKVFMEIDDFDIDSRKKEIWEKSVKILGEHFGQDIKFHNYRFLTPWMALNQDNYQRYSRKDEAERQLFLRYILRENLKSISKGVGYWIPDIDQVRVEGFFRKVERNFKNNRMVCFTGEFTMNFLVPDYLGVGKQTARGFGMIGRIS